MESRACHQLMSVMCENRAQGICSSDFQQNLEIYLCKMSQVLYASDKNKQKTLSGSNKIGLSSLFSPEFFLFLFLQSLTAHFLHVIHFSRFWNWVSLHHFLSPHPNESAMAKVPKAYLPPSPSQIQAAWGQRACVISGYNTLCPALSLDSMNECRINNGLLSLEGPKGMGGAVHPRILHSVIL